MNNESDAVGIQARTGPSSQERTQIISTSVINSGRIPPAPRNRLPNPARGSLGYLRHQRQLKIFITQVYCLATAFISLTMLQWVLITSNETFSNFFKMRYYISLVSGLSALLFLTFFLGFLEIRYTAPYNWIFAFSIVELETFALMWAPLESELAILSSCFLATLAVNVALTFIGNSIKKDLTQNVMLLTVISLVFYLSVSIVLIAIIAYELYFLKLYLIVGMLILLFLYILYTSQLIMGNRKGTIRWNDFILAALLVYINFVVILSLTLYLANEFMYF